MRAASPLRRAAPPGAIDRRLEPRWAPAEILLAAPALVALITISGCELLPLPTGLRHAVGGSGGHAGSGGPPCAAGGGSGGGASDGGFSPECTNCHGSEGNPSPPPDAEEQMDPSSPGVGAHVPMQRPSGWHRRVGCSQCHPVPRTPELDPCVPSHRNGETDFQWGSVAIGGIYDRESHTCSYTHCHGTLCGPDAVGHPPTVRVPVWTVVDGSQSGCGQACHSLPPGGTHGVDDDCERCHAGVIAYFDRSDPAASRWTDADRHIDGIFENDAGISEDAGDEPDASDAAVDDGGAEPDSGDAAVDQSV